MGEEEYQLGIESLNLNLAEICGKQYIIEHIVADYKQRSAEKMYKYYITDLLKSLAESQRISVNQRYYDMINENCTGEKTADQIAADILEEFERLGG